MRCQPVTHLLFAVGASLLAACIGPQPPQVLSPPVAPVQEDTPSPDGVQADLSVELDVREVRGTVRPLAGVQGGPLPIVSDDADLSAWYREGGVDHVRLPQDTLPDNLTLGGIFPEPFAQIDDPDAYDFRRIDRYVEAIVGAGATPLWQATYDVGGGDRLDADANGAQAGRLPEEPDRWAGAIRHTLMHFNDGWAEGHAWQVRYVEFVNAPFTLGGCETDSPSVAACWTLMETFAEAINTYNDDTGRDVQIVGPGVATSVGTLDEDLARLESLLDRLEPDELDYLSFHPQGRTPLEQLAIAQALRELLDTYDEGRFGRTGLWASQWKSSGAGPDGSLARIAARDTATRIMWQDTLDFATLYRADRRAQGPLEAADPLTGEVDCGGEVTCEDSLYFTPDGTPRTPFLPFLALAEMSAQTTQRIVVSNALQHATPVMAARSADGGQLGVLIAAPRDGTQTYEIRVEGLPPGVRFSAARFVVDEASEEWEPRETLVLETTSAGMLTLAGQLAGPVVIYWRLRTQ